MTRTTVVNVRTGEPFDVYIGRAVPRAKDRRCRVCSPWANPFGFKLPAGAPVILGVDAGCVEERLQIYEAALEAMVRRWPDEVVPRLLKLRGKRLGCWCKPDLCHGDVLVKVVERVARGEA